MKYIKEYYNYDNKVSEICISYGIRNWSIRDGLVDVDGNVNLYDRSLDKLPLKFGRVSGNFDCRHNQLTTLEGSPKEVGGSFDCSYNKLTSLEGGPKEVGGWLDCSYNQLTTLEHFPRVSGNIYLSVNPLPKEILDNIRYLKKIIEYGPEYDIWRNGELYLPRFRDLMIDIKEGL